MEPVFFRAPLKYALWSLLGLALLYLAATEIYQYLKRQNQQHYTVGLIYNSYNLTPNDLAVVKQMIMRRLDDINQKGGLNGHKLEVTYLDDKGSRDTVYQVVSQSLKDETMIGFVGCWGSSRVQAVTDLVGKAGIPFIGGYSVTSISRNYPNIFTFETGLEQITLVIENLIKTKGKKVAFIANSSDIYSEALLAELQKTNPQKDYKLVAVNWIDNNHAFKKTELKHLVDSLKLADPDLVILSTNRHHTNLLLSAFNENNFHLPVFTAFIDIQELAIDSKGVKAADLYDINVFGIPSTLNLRHQQQLALQQEPLPKSSRLALKVGLGGLFSDVIGLLIEAGQVEKSEQILPIRRQITRGLQEYINGKKIYRGWFTDWLFTQDRALVNEALLGWKPAGSESPILAPEQVVLGDSELQKAQVLFTRLDMEQLDQVSDEEATFYARFFFSVSSSERFSIKQIDFTNAVRNDINHRSLLDFKLLRSDSMGGKEPYFRQVYRVSGKFLFDPDLRKYPFDEQQFTITMQTNDAATPFLIQPNNLANRDTVFNSPGWLYRQHFIGYDQEIISATNKFVTQPRHLAGYKFNFTYVLKRAKVDFYLKVITPLLAILIITYFSIFIPIREFESVTAIQVTALLSSIALYFSAYKPAGQFATVSDKIFILTYIMITTLIGTSVLELYLYKKRREHRRISLLINIYEWFLFPIIVALATFFLIG